MSVLSYCSCPAKVEACAPFERPVILRTHGRSGAFTMSVSRTKPAVHMTISALMRCRAQQHIGATAMQSELGGSQSGRLQNIREACRAKVTKLTARHSCLLSMKLHVAAYEWDANDAL